MMANSSSTGDNLPNLNYDISKIVLNSALLRLPNRLNICHLNISSVINKIDIVRSIFDGSNAHVAIFSETWFKSHHSNKSISIPGFKVLRCDRKNKRGGGVAAYVRDGIKCKVVHTSIGCATEHLLLEIILPRSKILIFAIYKAPDVRDMSEFCNLIENFSSSYSDVIVVGDFNVDMLTLSNGGACTNCRSGSCRSCQLLTIMQGFNLSLLGSEPTHFTNGISPTQIDLMWTNNLNKVN